MAIKLWILKAFWCFQYKHCMYFSKTSTGTVKVA